jgi:ASC-1-like (ASCH) protein
MRRRFGAGAAVAFSIPRTDLLRAILAVYFGSLGISASCGTLEAMATHQLRLATKPFSAVSAGKKTIESALYDEKRRAIQVGDLITFVNREDPKQTVMAQVVGLLRYATFADLFADNEPAEFGVPSREHALREVRDFYSEDDEEAEGVLGIRFELV